MKSFSNKELKQKPDLGDFILCPHCQNRHLIKYGNKVLSDGTKEPTKLLAFYRCGDKTYLAGIDGKNIMK